MKGETYVPTSKLICIQYRDDDSGSWRKKGDPVIDDIEQGLPKVVDKLNKGDVLTIYREGEPGFDGNLECKAILADSQGEIRVCIFQKDWDGDELFKRKGKRGFATSKTESEENK